MGSVRKDLIPILISVGHTIDLSIEFFGTGALNCVLLCREEVFNLKRKYMTRNMIDC